MLLLTGGWCKNKLQNTKKKPKTKHEANMHANRLYENAYKHFNFKICYNTVKGTVNNI